MYFHKLSEYTPTWKNNLLACCIIFLPLPYLFSDLIFLNYGDMYIYIRKACEIGAGNINLIAVGDRTALFPFILHLLFKLFGYSLFPIKAFCVFLLSVLCVQAWIICRVLTGNNSGIISSFFIATSFVFGHFAYFPHIDLLLIVCLNFCLLVLYKAVRAQKNQFKWIFLSGLFFGMTYALKQVSIVLVLLLPLYFVFSERALLFRIFKAWGVQLLGLSIFLVPIAILSHHNFFGYVWSYAKNIHQSDGATIFSHDPSMLRMLTYYFDPVFWQWDKVLPYNIVAVRFDQIIALLAFILFLYCSNLERKAKSFILLTVLIFLPLYTFVAYKGYKLRQLLFPEFVIFLTVGPVVQYFLMSKLKSRLSRNNWSCLAAGLCLLLCAIYGLRIYSVNRTIQESVGHLSEVLHIDPEYTEMHNKLGFTLASEGRFTEAINHFSIVERTHVITYTTEHYNLGVTLAKQGRFTEAIKHFSEALQINPGLAEAHNRIGIALANQGKIVEAINHFSEALRLDPNHVEARHNLNKALVLQGKQ